jgi:hypothetical protein
MLVNANNNLLDESSTPLYDQSSMGKVEESYELRNRVFLGTTMNKDLK